MCCCTAIGLTSLYCSPYILIDRLFRNCNNGQEHKRTLRLAEQSVVLIVMAYPDPNKIRVIFYG
jgi:hypothetical protein